MPTTPHSYCHACGERLSDSDEWPKQCSNQHYTNPIDSVVVLLVEVDDQLLIVQRAIPPHIGAWAFCGGYQNRGEDWTACAVRELQEETHIVAPISQVRLYRLKTVDHGRKNLIFAIVRVDATALQAFVPTDEVTAVRMIQRPEDLCFPAHTEVLHDYFAERNVAPC